MIKIHKQQVAFLGLLGAFFVLTTAILNKYVPLLLHHTVYYCQELLNSFSIQLPKGLGFSVFGIALILMAVVAIKIVMTVIKIQRFRHHLLAKRVKNDQLKFLEKKLALNDKVVLMKDSRPQAFCFGIRNPKIYISSGLLQLMNQKELEVILRHEKYQLKHRDTLTLLLATMIESLFPFFPVVSDFIRVYRMDREVAADNAAITNATDKQSLKDVLRKLIQYEPDTNPLFLPAIMSIDTLEARIHSMNLIDTTYKKISVRNLSVSVLSLIALLGLMVTPVNAIELHEEGQDVVMLCNNTARCESVCRTQALQKLQSSQQQYTPATTINFSSVK